MVDFKALETVLWVARLESFHAAAERLNTTQPAISNRIAELEADLGTKLFSRTTRRVTLTPAGRHVIDYAERLLRLRAEMIGTIADSTTRRGTLRLGVAETIVHTWLPGFLELMAARYPAMTIDLDVDISINLRERLIQHRLDLAFAVGPLAMPAIIERKLCSLPIRFIASPALGLPSRPVGLEVIARWPILTFARNTAPYAQVIRMFAATGSQPPRIFASASLATLVRMALDGLGVAVIPEAIVADELARGQLVLLRSKASFPDLEFVAAWLDLPEHRLIGDIVELADRAAQIAAPSISGPSGPASPDLAPPL